MLLLFIVVDVVAVVIFCSQISQSYLFTIKYTRLPHTGCLKKVNF
jgi:nicotinamide riboside transporter PnuC